MYLNILCMVNSKLLESIFLFFESKENYHELEETCKYYCESKKDQGEILHDVFLSLVKKAEAGKTINFPSDPNDPDSTIRYVKRVIRYHWLQGFRTKKGVVNTGDQSNQKTEIDPNTPRYIYVMEQLDKLNELIQQNHHLFTDRQLAL